MVAVQGRHAVWYVLHRRALATTLEIERLTGYDHSTVWSGTAKTAKLLKARNRDTQELVGAVVRAIPTRQAPLAAQRAEDARALLDTAERLAPIVEALGHALARMGQQIASTVDEARQALDAVDNFERGAA